MFMCSLQ